MGLDDEINVLALVKGCERYIFFYDDESRAETLRVLGRFEVNDELSFTGFDSAVLSQIIRQKSLKYSPEGRFDMPLSNDMDEF